MSDLRANFSGNKGNDKPSKKEKIEALKQKHLPLFEKLGVVNPLFYPKLVFGTPKVFYLFPSELKHKRDIYLEMVDTEYNSEDPERSLYKWTYNPNYEEDYKQKKMGQSNDMISIVPFEELELIPEEDEADEFKIPDPDEDAPISDLTIRDLTAILTGKPVSRKNWLNKIINS